VVSWLRDRDPAVPFFAYVAPYAPHAGAIAAPGDIGRFAGALPFRSPAINETHDEKAGKPLYVRNRDLSAQVLAAEQDFRRQQLDTLRSFDRQIGRMLQVLQDEGQLSNTIVLYLSDNGFLWGQHDLIGKSVPYEASIGVPYYLRFDGLGPAIAGTFSDDIVSNVDIAPTIYDLALDGFRPAFPLDGQNLLAGASGRAFIYIEGLFRGTGSPSFCGVVSSNGWKYVVYEPAPQLIDVPFEDELYNLSEDPNELLNRADAPHFGLVRRYMRNALAGVCSLPDATQDWYRAWQS
jgi:arylsulfatase A-like enzyme